MDTGERAQKCDKLHVCVKKLSETCGDSESTVKLTVLRIFLY